MASPPAMASRALGLWQHVTPRASTKPLTAQERLALKFCPSLVIPPVATTPKEREALPPLPDWPTLRWTLPLAATRHEFKASKLKYRAQCAPKTQEAALSTTHRLTIGHPNLRQLHWATSFIFRQGRLERVVLQSTKQAAKADESALLGELIRRHGRSKVTHRYASNAQQETTYRWNQKATTLVLKTRVNLRNQKRSMKITYSRVVKGPAPRKP